MTKLHLLAENQVASNAYPDTLQLVRSVLALSLSVSQSQIDSFQTNKDILIHVEDSIEPLDEDLPDGTAVFWVNMGPPSRLFVKVKSDSGVVKTGRINLT